MPKDKIYHFSACFIVSFALAFAFPNVKVLAPSFAEGLSWGKEAGDFMNYGKEVGYKAFAKMAAGDLLADNIGIVAGTCSGLALRRFFDAI